MTDRTQHVLDAIDGALGDWSVSGDAMRWTPEPGIPHGLEHRRVPGFRGGRIPPPPQNGRGPASIGLAQVWIQDETHVWPDRSAETAELAQRYREALRELVLATARLFDTLDVERIAAAVEQLADIHVDDDQDEAVTEEPRARALRLRRERNTGPSRDLVHQRRPRRVP